MGIESEEGRISVYRDAYHVAFSHIEGLRGTGRTYRACQRVADYMLDGGDPQKILVWRVPALDWSRHIVQMMTDVLESRGVHRNLIAWNPPVLTVIAPPGVRSYRLRFVTRHMAQEFRTQHGIHWVYDEGECFYHEYLSWLRDEIDTEPT